MKKFLSLPLALVLVFALAIPVMAWTGIGNGDRTLAIADGVVVVVTNNNENEPSFTLTISEDAALGHLQLRHSQSGDILFDARTDAPVGPVTFGPFAQGTVQYVWTEDAAERYIVSEVVTGFKWCYHAALIGNGYNKLTFFITETIYRVWSDGESYEFEVLTVKTFDGLANNIDWKGSVTSNFTDTNNVTAVYNFTANGNFNALQNFEVNLIP